MSQELIERLKLEAQIHAQEARTANATIAEIYQLCSGGKGEPGNWHGAEPVRALIAERDQLAATLRQQAARVDEHYSRDVRHLIYLDTQFSMRGETDLKLPEMQALEARGWIAEGQDNGEYVVTDDGERALEAALSAKPAERQGDAKPLGWVTPEDVAMLRGDEAIEDIPLFWYANSSEMLPVYLHPAAPVGVPDGWTATRDNDARMWTVLSPSGDSIGIHDQAADLAAELLRQLAQDIAAPSAPQGVE